MTRKTIPGKPFQQAEMKRRIIPVVENKKKEVKVINRKDRIPKKIRDKSEVIIEGLNENQRMFCREYIYDWNGTRAYKKVYGEHLTDNVAGVSANQLLRIPKIKEYMTEIQKDVAKLCGVSKQMVLDEVMAVAFSNISNLHNTWIERKDFELLSERDKKSIASIDTQIVKRNIGTKKVPEIVDVEMIKVKLHSKDKFIEILNKMTGYFEPEKTEQTVTFTGDPFKQIRENNGING